jgi:hypothetical protein
MVVELVEEPPFDKLRASDSPTVLRYIRLSRSAANKWDSDNVEAVRALLVSSVLRGQLADREGIAHLKPPFKHHPILHIF